MIPPSVTAKLNTIKLLSLTTNRTKRFFTILAVNFKTECGLQNRTDLNNLNLSSKLLPNPTARMA